MIIFPNNPTQNQLFTSGGKTWIYQDGFWLIHRLSFDDILIAELDSVSNGGSIPDVAFTDLGATPKSIKSFIVNIVSKLQDMVVGDFVDLTSTQTITGSKTFSGALTFSNLSALTENYNIVAVNASGVVSYVTPQTLFNELTDVVTLSSTQTITGSKTFGPVTFSNTVTLSNAATVSGEYDMLVIDSAGQVKYTSPIDLSTEVPAITDSRYMPIGQTDLMLPSLDSIEIDEFKTGIFLRDVGPGIQINAFGDYGPTGIFGFSLYSDGSNILLRSSVNSVWSSYVSVYTQQNANLSTVDWTAKTLTLANALSVQNGGTGLNSITQGDLLFGSASNVVSRLPKSTAVNSFLKNAGTSNNPVWSTISLNDLSNTNIGTLSNAQLLRYDSTTSKWVNFTPTWVTTDTNTTYSINVPNATKKIQLLGSDSSTSEIEFLQGSNITITRTSATQLTVATATNVQFGQIGIGVAPSATYKVYTDGYISGTRYYVGTTRKDLEWDSAYADRMKWDGGSTGLIVGDALTSLGLTGDSNTTHYHDSRYYTKTNIDAFFAGTTSKTGYNKSNWDAAYTHISSTGTDHSYINQAVLTTSTPTFSGIQGNGTTWNMLLSNSSYILMRDGANSSTIRFYPDSGNVWAAGTITATGGNSTEWNAAYTDRLKWDGGSTGLNATTGRTSLGLGTAATKDVGTSSGNVMEVGAFGLGGVALDGGWNTHNYTRLVWTATDTPLGFSTMGIKIYAGSTYTFDISGRNDRFHVRTLDDGTQQDWRELYHTGNLVNPVTGTGTAGQVSFWDGTGSQTGSNNLVWDNTSGLLSLPNGSGGRGVAINNLGIRFVSSSTGGWAMALNSYDSSGTIMKPLVGVYGGADSHTYTYIGGSGYNDAAIYAHPDNTVSIGKTSVTSGYMLDVNGAIRAAGDMSITGNYLTTGQNIYTHYNNTAVTAKYSRLLGRNYDGTYPITGLMISGSATDINDIRIGGGTSSGYASTLISFWTAANASTTTGTQRAYIDNTKFNMSGNIYATGTITAVSTVTASNFVLSSDIRLKEYIQSIQSDFSDIEFKQFQMKDDSRIRYGAIAQQVEKNHPELVYEDANGYKQLAYIDLIIAKLNDAYKRIAELESKIK